MSPARWLPLAALLLPSLASAQEFRQFKLADGREFVARVVATEASGIRVRVPQGEMLVPFSQLADMVPVTQASYDNQTPWIVYVAAPPESRSLIIDAFDAIPRVEVHGQPASRDVLSAAQEHEMRACNYDLECLVGVTAGLPWMWVVAARREGSEVVLSGAVTTGATRNRVRLSVVDAERVRYAALDILEVSPAEEVVAETPPTVATAPTPPATTPAETPPATTPPPANPPTTPIASREPDREPTGDGPSRDRVMAMAYVPVPGLPSLMARDTAGFAASWLTVLPTTALFVGVSGQVATSGYQHAAFGVGGFYAATVLANQFFGARSIEKRPVLGVLPTEGGGTQVVVVVSPRDR